MSKYTITVKQVEQAFPEMKGFEPDGSTDYKRVVEICGRMAADQIWAIVNCYSEPAIRRAEASRVDRLFGKVSRR